MKSRKNIGQLIGSNTRFCDFLASVCILLTEVKRQFCPYTQTSVTSFDRETCPRIPETRWSLMSNPTYPAPSSDQGVPRTDLEGCEVPSVTGPESEPEELTELKELTVKFRGFSKIFSLYETKEVTEGKKKAVVVCVYWHCPRLISYLVFRPKIFLTTRRIGTDSKGFLGFCLGE